MSVRSDGEFASGPDLAPVLLALLRREGIGILEQRGRLNGLLRDYAPMAIRDIRLLLVAHDAGTPARLQASVDPLAAAPLADEADRMVDEFGCAKPLALNAVRTWARALSNLRNPVPAGAAEAQPIPAYAGETVAIAEEEQPGWFARWGGIALAIVLVLIALVRWLGA